MKLNIKPNIKRFLFTLIFLILFSSTFKAFSNEEINHNEFNEETPNQIEQSGFWNLTGSPIIIDDSDPDYNWSKTAAQNDWCSGSGTWIAPYIIENVTIYAQDSGSCIYIQNSNDYFIIQNCSLFNASNIHNAGITLKNVTNGKIISNHCYDTENGILLEDSDNNTILENSASNNRVGIYLDESENNTISENIVSYKNSYGIFLYESDNNMVSGNTASYNAYNGIYLYECNNNNTISENTASYNIYFGIYLRYSSDNNTISGNTVNNNGAYGIFLPDSSYNSIFLNYFSNNEQNALDDGNNNTWDNGSIGNFWDDYTGVDANNDGIGDTPYLIPGSAGSQDNFPIWKSQPSIPFGNYFLLFTIIAIVSLTIIEKQKKTCHLR